MMKREQLKLKSFSHSKLMIWAMTVATFSRITVLFAYMYYFAVLKFCSILFLWLQPNFPNPKELRKLLENGNSSN